MPLKPFKEFSLQWHITNHCEMNCRHCYINDAEKKFTITKEQFFSALQKYIAFLNYYDLNGRIYFTGGDPLLHNSFKNFLEEASRNGIKIAIMGNYHQLNDKNISLLKRYDIRFYQLSLDGTKKYHEAIRGAKTFDATIKAINLLENNGIFTIINMTLMKDNINQMIPLIKILSKTKLSRFDFVRVVPMGKSNKQDLIKPLYFRKLLLSLLKLESEMKQQGKKLEIGKKDHLWKLLYFENNRLKININEKAYGCGMGFRHLTILPNGNVLLCRKIEKKIGNIITDDLIEIYKENKIIQKTHKCALIESCHGCKIEKVCRGCPAIGYAINGDFKYKDPQCWRKNI